MSNTDVGDKNFLMFSSLQGIFSATTLKNNNNEIKEMIVYIMYEVK